MDMTVAQLDDARCPRSYWPYALRNSVYIKNPTPHAAIDGVMPIEACPSEKPDLAYLRAFGCAAYAPVPTEKRRKLDAKAVQGILVGRDVTLAEKGIATDAPAPPLPAPTLRHPQKRTGSPFDTEVSPLDTDEEEEVGEAEPEELDLPPRRPLDGVDPANILSEPRQGRQVRC
ncbi:hypothetical protein JCM21900_001662 [Sporobolomyces salmonicolor]